MENQLKTYSVYLQTLSVAANTARNYLSDVEQFLSWLVEELSRRNLHFRTNLYDLLYHLTFQELDTYVNHLQTEGLTVNTVNRKIASLKNYLTFSFHQGWTNGNFSKHLKFLKKDNHESLSIQTLLSDYEEELRREGLSLISRRNYLSDVQQFLSWLQRSV